MITRKHDEWIELSWILPHGDGFTIKIHLNEQPETRQDLVRLAEVIDSGVQQWLIEQKENA